jgi:hypothetical protein
MVLLFAAFLTFTSSGFTQTLLRAVENGGAGDYRGRLKMAARTSAFSVEVEDRGVSPYLAQLRREARECEPTWSCGPKYVGVC